MDEAQCADREMLMEAWQLLGSSHQMSHELENLFLRHMAFWMFSRGPHPETTNHAEITSHEATPSEENQLPPPQRFVRRGARGSSGRNAPPGPSKPCEPVISMPSDAEQLAAPVYGPTE